MGLFDGFDFAALARMLSYPGIDPRQWVSLGLVDADTPQSRSVNFNAADGSPLPYPLVNVTLQPSGVQVSCRVGSQSAGAGTGEWNPFIAGDEVLVAVPGGDEREGCVILCRLNQGLDTFPRVVGGNDVTGNTVNFKRMVEPHIVESGTAIMLRVASVGSFLSLDPLGNVTATNGSGHYLALHDDQLTLQTKDTSCTVQLNPSSQTVFLQAKTTQLLLQPDQGASHLLTQGTMSLVTSGGGYAPGHAVTIEQVVNLLNVFLLLAAAASTPPAGNPITLTAFFASFLTPATLPGIIAAAASAGFLTPDLSSAITAGLASQTPDPTGVLPGIGRPGLTY